MLSLQLLFKNATVNFHSSYLNNENLKSLYFSSLAKHKSVFPVVNHKNNKDVHFRTYLFLVLMPVAKEKKKLPLFPYERRAVCRCPVIL